MRAPLDQYSEVVDQNRRWNSEWYSWLQELFNDISGVSGIEAELQALELRVDAVEAELDGILGGQLPFPAIQNPSMDPNTLDDYEEGSWTPVLTFALGGDLAVTYSAQDGKFVKIGKLVSWSFVIATSAFTHTTASGPLRVAGLPHLHDLTGGIQSVGGAIFSGINVSPGAYSQIAPRVELNSTFMVFGASGMGVAAGLVDAVHVATGGTVLLQCAGQYRAAQ